MEDIDEKFKDPKTGETVTHRKIPEKFSIDLYKNVEMNAKHANEFMQLSRQLVQIQIAQKKSFDAASEAEQFIGKEVIRLREKMGLDSSWVYSLPLKMMERRTPPNDNEDL